MWAMENRRGVVVGTMEKRRMVGIAGMAVWLGMALLGVAGAGCWAQERGEHNVVGYVREEGTSVAIPGVRLEISQSAGASSYPPALSGIDGAFAFHDLAEAVYVITATKSGYDTTTTNVTIMRTGTPDVRISMKRSSSGATAIGSPISAHELQAPKKARSAYEKGVKLLGENNAAGSIPEFEKAVKEYPGFYEAYSKLGVANYHLGKGPEAEAALKKSIELSDGKFAEPLYLLADLYNGQKKYGDAADLGRQAVTADSTSWNGYFELARAQVGLKQTSDAETNAVKARDLAPQNPQVYLLLANVHVQQQNYKAAVQDFDAYLKLDPNGPSSEAVKKTRDRLEKQAQKGTP